jgi:hypothetical protein
MGRTSRAMQLSCPVARCDRIRRGVDCIHTIVWSLIHGAQNIKMEESATSIYGNRPKTIEAPATE